MLIQHEGTVQDYTNSQAATAPKSGPNGCLACLYIYRMDSGQKTARSLPDFRLQLASANPYSAQIQLIIQQQDIAAFACLQRADRPLHAK